jgi:hypothetical protein
MLAGSHAMRNALFGHQKTPNASILAGRGAYVCYFSVHASILYKVEITF